MPSWLPSSATEQRRVVENDVSQLKERFELFHRANRKS